MSRETGVETGAYQLPSDGSCQSLDPTWQFSDSNGHVGTRSKRDPHLPSIHYRRRIRLSRRICFWSSTWSGWDRKRSLKGAVEGVTVDDGCVCASTANVEVARDIQIALRVAILVGARDGERIGSGW